MNEISIGSATSAKITGTTTRLIELEIIIERGKHTFFEVGNALAQIMEDQLYREKGFGSFAEYCATVWKFKKSYAYQLVQSSELLKELPAPVSTIVENMNPGQVRELVKVPKSERETVIKTAVAKSKTAGRKLTAKDISTAAQPLITTVVEVMPAKDVQVRCPKAQSQRQLQNWYCNTTKEKRSQFLNFIFSYGEVEVEDKAKFKQRMDRWFENHVHQKGEATT